MITNETAAVVLDAGAPIGPGEAEESVFLAEQRQSGPSTAAVSTPVEGEASDVPLPPMDELIQRIPAATRELVDQLFRAKFITVKRIPTSAFKTQI